MAFRPSLLLALLISASPLASQNQQFGGGQVVTNSIDATSLSAEDLDQDGDLDVLGCSAGLLGWFENFGGGSFSSWGVPQVINTGVSGPLQSAGFADLDGDGSGDIFAANMAGGSFSQWGPFWHSKLGGSVFSEERRLSVFAEDLVAGLATDMTGNGRLDILIQERDSSTSFYPVYLYESLPGGAWTWRLLFEASDLSWSLCAFDADGDGDQDLLTSGIGVYWHENLGGNLFSPNKPLTTTTGTFRDASAHDLDGDGDLDVLACHFSLNEVVWFENLGNATFGNLKVITNNADGAYAATAADLDGDGDLDVLSASQQDDRVAWYENTGSGQFGSQQNISTSADLVRDIGAADLDGDLDLDVFSASYGDDKVAWYENLGSGTFGAEKIIWSNADGASLVLASDLDSDNDLDLVSFSSNSGLLSWYENQGSGVFGWVQGISTNAFGLSFVSANDWDQDGDIDVLYDSGGVTSFDEVVWTKNNGGSFYGEELIWERGGDPDDVVAADLNNDGHSDLVWGETDSIVWSMNLGDGTFRNRDVVFQSASGWLENSIHSCDLDGDGDIDILAAATDNSISWFENFGNGDFGPQRFISTAVLNPESVFAADLDGDGDLDVLSASSDDDKIAWYENLGGGFGPQRVISISADGAAAVQAADLDGDGDVDVASVSSSDGEVAWYENLGNGNFTAQRIIDVFGNGATTLDLRDINGDGFIDVLAGGSGSILWYENLGQAGPVYTVSNLRAGHTAIFTVTGATPLNLVRLGYSIAGPGPTNTVFGPVAMSPPISLLGDLMADSNGIAQTQAPVPSGVAGVVLYTQGVDLASGLLTNPLAETILP